MKKIESIEELDRIQHTQFILFKHSITCDISAMAYEVFEQYMKNCPIPAYYLYVQDARIVSNEIASRYGIKHESPQVLLVKNKEVVWHTSHWKIKLETLKEHIG